MTWHTQDLYAVISNAFPRTTRHAVLRRPEWSATYNVPPFIGQVDSKTLGGRSCLRLIQSFQPTVARHSRFLADLAHRRCRCYSYRSRVSAGHCVFRSMISKEAAHHAVIKAAALLADAGTNCSNFVQQAHTESLNG